jgi:fructose-1,6-bisphosphatase
MSDERFRALVARVGEFYITDRAMKNAQKKIQAELAGGAAGETEQKHYLDAVKRYFTGFEREARAQLRDVDTRLVHVNQVHFNLTAERGVVVKRIEATQDVLKEIDDGARSARG